MERRIKLSIGKSGFGKTYLARILLASEMRALIVDQRDEYEGTPFYDFDQMADHVSVAPRFRAVWKGGMDFTDAIFHLAFALTNVTVVLEEADLVECEGWYREAIYRGRMPARISILAIAQRPHLLSPDLRSQATDIYAFNNSEPSALQWLKIPFGDDAEKFPHLPPKHGLHYSLDAAGPNVTPFHLP